MTDTRRKILVISGVFPPARIAEADHVLHICRNLAKRGFDVEVLTRQGSVEGADLPFQVHPIMRQWNWAELPRLLKAARQFAPDLVFLWFVGHTYDFHPMITIVPTLLKRILPHTTVVTQITGPIGSSPKRHPLPTRLLWKAARGVLGSAGLDYGYGTLFRDSDRVIVMANTHLKHFTRLAPALPAKSVFVPPPPLLPLSSANAESRRRGRQALGVGDDDFVFAYFGRLYSNKGVATLLKAFQKLHAVHSNVKLAIIGGADANWHHEEWRVVHLYELSQALAIDESVVWTGEFPWDSDLGSVYLRAADAVVLPFDNGVDMNNSSFAAAAAHGLPTVTTRGAYLDDTFLDGENVLLCPSLDPVAMASAMERLLKDPELRQHLRSGIGVLASDWFSWDVSVDRTISAFDSVGAPARRPGAKSGPVRVARWDRDR